MYGRPVYLCKAGLRVVRYEVGALAWMNWPSPHCLCELGFEGEGMWGFALSWV